MSENAEQILKTYLEMPASFWIKILVAGAVLWLLLMLLKKLAHIGQVIVLGIVLLAVVVIGYKWVRYRGEPEFMTPAVDFVSSFFATQAEPPDAGSAPAPK